MSDQNLCDKKVSKKWNAMTNQKALSLTLKKGGIGRKLKDPDAPIKNKTTYNLFCKEVRPKITKELTKKLERTPTMPEMSVALGASWSERQVSTRAVDKKLIKQLQKTAKDDKERYLDEMKTYERPSEEELIRLPCNAKASGIKRIKDPAAPTGARSSYILFCTENRSIAKKKVCKEMDDDSPDQKEVTRKLGVMWKELKGSTTKTGKTNHAKYVTDAENDKKRFLKEMESYIRPSEAELLQRKEEIKSARSKKTRGKGGPKRNKSAYVYFCAENRAKVTASLIDEISGKADTKKVTKELGAKWKEFKVSEDEDDIANHNKYKKSAKDDKERYEAELLGDFSKSPVSTTPATSPKILRGKTSYTNFLDQNREATKDEMGENTTARNVTKALSARWKTMTKEEKEEYK